MTAHDTTCTPLDLNAFRRHQAEVLAQGDPRADLDLAPDTWRRLKEFVELHGEEHLLTMLRLAWDPDMGPGSKVALETVKLHVQAQLPVALIVKYDPRNKNPQRQRDVRAITGGALSLVMDLAPARA